MHKSQMLVAALLGMAAGAIQMPFSNREVGTKHLRPYSGKMKGRGNSHMAPPERNRHKKKKWHGTPAGH